MATRTILGMIGPIALLLAVPVRAAADDGPEAVMKDFLEHFV